jgi:hypothetical protein
MADSLDSFADWLAYSVITLQHDALGSALLCLRFDKSNDPSD